MNFLTIGTKLTEEAAEAFKVYCKERNTNTNIVLRCMVEDALKDNDTKAIDACRDILSLFDLKEDLEDKNELTRLEDALINKGIFGILHAANIPESMYLFLKELHDKEEKIPIRDRYGNK